MKRRDFVRTSAAAGAAGMAPGLLHAEVSDLCVAEGHSASHSSLRSADSGVGAAGVPSAPLDELTVEELQRRMTSGELTSREITRLYLERIDSLDRKGPELRHMLDLNPDALEIAARLDGERKQGRVRGPMHGIPVLIKDNIDTADRMTTTAGSLALEGSIPSRDAFIAKRLRDAGAVLLGKTNLSEWANIRSTRSSSGWSARGGQGRNPYALDRNPCGSSSGSGGAISANYAAVAVGTETDGSIVCPSSANGLAGIKPTLGLVSRSGIIPIAHSQDTAGPMARTVADAATLLAALAGIDPRDSATNASRGHTHTDYTRFLDANGLRGARIGVARERYMGYSPSADKVIDEAIVVMKDRGATIIDPANIPTAGKFDDTELEVLLYELKADLNAYLATLGPKARVKSLADVIEFNETNKSREMPYFGQELFLRAQEKGPLTSKEYVDALAKNHRMSRAEGIDAVMNQHRLDAIVAPTGTAAWPIDLVNGDHYIGASSTPAAVAGYPNINVLAGYVHGLPVGMSIFGRAWSEPKLISIAYSFEQATKHRRAPQFIPTLGGFSPVPS